MSTFDTLSATADDLIFRHYSDTVDSYARYDSADPAPAGAVRVILDRDVEVQPDGEYQFSTRRTEASFLLAEINPRKYDRFTVGGTEYSVIERLQDDGHVVRVVVK